MTDERTNGSLRACEADATCHAPAVHRVNVLRPGWKVPESRQHCIMHAAQVLPVDAPATTVTAYDAPVRRPLRAEVLAALASDPRHLSVIRKALTRPALPMTVRRELDALIEEGLAVEGPPSHFARQEATVKPAKTQRTLTQHERVLEDVRAHPWTSVGDIMRRTEDGAASARLTQAVQAGEIVRIGEKRSYRYAMPGTPIPGLGAEGGPTVPVEGESADCNAVAPPEVVSASAPAMEESPEWGVADAPAESFGRPMTLAERLARPVGVDLVGGDVAIVEAVERIVAERDAAKALAEEHLARAERAVEARERTSELLDELRAERDAAKARADRLDAMGSDLITDFLGGLRSALDLPPGDWSAAEMITMVDAFRSEVVDELDRADAAPAPTLDRLTAVVDELIRARTASTKSPDTRTLIDLRNAIEGALDLAGACSDEDLIAAVRDAATTSALVRDAVQASPFATPEEVAAEVAHRTRVATPTVLATANASLREIGGGIAKRRVGCTVGLGSGSAFFPLSDEAARTLAPLLFRGVTVALLAPVPVPTEAPAVPIEIDDIPF